MITREDLLKSSEYWIEIIQNKIYNDLMEYIERNGASNKDLANILGISKGRVSQILSGDNLNFRLDSLVKLCLAIDKIPSFQMEDIEKYIEADLKETEPIMFKNIPTWSKTVTEKQTYDFSDFSQVTRISATLLSTHGKTTGAAETLSERAEAA
jgi:predicted XRE-type DNA-binding protein